MSEKERNDPESDRLHIQGVRRSALAVLDAIGQAVIATDLEGNVTYWSPAAEALYGWSEDEALDRPVFALTPAEAELGHAHAVMAELVETGSWTGEIELSRKDGSTFLGLVTNALIRDDAGRPIGVVGVSYDISDLKATEADLRERVKELHTLISASEILSDGSLDRDARLQRLVDRIPEGWVDPSTTAARLVLHDRTFRSERFTETDRAMSASVVVRGHPAGSLDVVRTSAEEGEPAFIPEERELLDTLARIVGETLSRDRAAARLSRTIDALDEAVLVLENVEGDRRVVAANAAAERIFGHHRDDLIGETVDHLHAEDHEREQLSGDAGRALREVGVYHAAATLVRRDGETFPAEITVSLLHAERGHDDGLVYVARDVSERHRARTDLLRERERFRIIAEHLEDVLWIGDVANGTIEYVSPAYRAVWGEDPAPLFSDASHWKSTLHPDDVERVGRLDALADPFERDIEYRIVRPDGDTRWIHDRTFLVHDDRGEPARVIGIAADITHRRRAEERLRAITREISDAIYVLDADARVRYATSSVGRVTNFPVEAFEGVDALSVVHPDDRERVRDRFAWVSGAPQRRARIEYRFIDMDGTERDVESIARNLFGHPGVDGILVTTRDVTERVAMERALEESQRLEAIGRLAGGIAHDFNNLLTIIRSQTALLRVDVDDPGITEELEVIEKAGDRAAELTSQLLAFSRDQVLQPRLVSLCAVVKRIGTLVERVLGADIRLEMRLHGDLPTVELDPVQLEQVLLNLAINARDAMPGGGTLSLETRRLDVDETTEEFSAISPGTYVELVVSDTGVGMEPEVASRAFEPFFTTKTEARGTGLGLATAYGFVRQSGGDIALRSEPGRGTTFRLAFPTVDQPPADIESAAPTPVGDVVHSGRVLLVEDEDSVRRVAIRILERGGLEVEG
ncbi:MAG TPA: PAS domain S-box protein, partial [Longimicrobiales bacterium]|nr:PAS domain S-box protein [Longimicrobiales bacterium]